jgi:uncharacterized protein YdbL (DUF1318 family)
MKVVIIALVSLVLSSLVAGDGLAADAQLATRAIGPSLGQARSTGAVVESSDGYVRAANGAAAEVRRLVTQVNQRRRDAYKKIADKNGTSVVAVAAASYQKRRGKGGASR